MRLPGRTSTRVLAVGAVVAVAGAAYAWTAAAGDRGLGRPPEGYRIVHVGEEAVAFGSPKEGVLETRWRDRSGRWSHREQVEVPGAGSWNAIEEEVAGSTLVASVSFLGPIADATGEPSGPGAKVSVACFDGHCTTDAKSPGVTAADEPQLTPDGRTAYFGRTSDGYVVWRRGHGLGVEKVSGLPANPSEPLLAPDGSFRAVQGVRDRQGCQMRLFTTGRTGTAFLPSTSFRRALSASRPTCASSLESVRSDSVTVSTLSSVTPVFLAVRHGSWTRVARDPSGLVHLVRRRGTLVGFSTRTGFWHDRELMVASPDGRRVTVQLHRRGATTWTAPRTVARIPAGRQCFDIAPTSTIGSDPFYLSVRCRSRATPSSSWVYSYVHALSDDGTAWVAVHGTDLPLRVGDDLLFQGHPTYRWSARTGLRRVALSVPTDANYSLLADGTSVLTRVVGRSGACTLEVRLAAAGSTSWSELVPNTTGGMPSGADCVLPHVQTEKSNAYFYYASTKPAGLMDRLVRRGGTWVVEKGFRP